MHQEIEKLIDLAIADGQVTEKERNVILKKARELGVDIAEVEMTIDAKKHLHERNTVGSQIKCPSCGNRLSGLSKTCSCGFVFNSGSLNESKSLEASIETLENLIVQVRSLSDSSSLEVLESLTARVEKEIRFIKTRYSDNVEIKKLTIELESLSSKYITIALNKKKKRRLITSIVVILAVSFYGFLFIKNRTIKSNESAESTNFNIKLDSISNAKLKESVRSRSYSYRSWEPFKSYFFEHYPEVGEGYVFYLESKYGFSEETNYKIAENQFKNIMLNFQQPIDFILHDDRNNFRNLESTSRIDSTFILTLISKKRWQLKREIDDKIGIIQNYQLQEDLIPINDIDSLKKASLVFWNDGIKNFILNKQNGIYPRQGWVERTMQTYRTDRQTATNYCKERLSFFEKKFKMPIDFFYYRDYIYHSRTIKNPIRNDKDDLENINACEKKFNLKSY